MSHSLYQAVGEGRLALVGLLMGLNFPSTIVSQPNDYHSKLSAIHILPAHVVVMIMWRPEAGPCRLSGWRRALLDLMLMYIALSRENVLTSCHTSRDRYTPHSDCSCLALWAPQNTNPLHHPLLTHPLSCPHLQYQPRWPPMDRAMAVNVVYGFELDFLSP
ncbi:hypothetical protein MIND_00905700 [Mycena indigotica]|uniref:Uncharacterized protein n=1 Tax=Mycena indigotica TaxID=2126181 RepID=A0A8H6SBZ8_9AGAR|nr:uncharacterized protein MIND_00905700 [Mycena indigotica]KAF7296751.1 hypothetical protein MIND_00905700 [Mycena indigotica]